MPKIDGVIEFVSNTIKGFADFIETLDKEIRNVTSDSDNSIPDVRRKYENYKIKKVSNANKVSDEYLASDKKPNEGNETTFIGKKAVSDDTDFLNLDFTEENLMQAMVYTEIFGEPKAKRRRR